MKSLYYQFKYRYQIKRMVDILENIHENSYLLPMRPFFMVRSLNNEIDQVNNMWTYKLYLSYIYSPGHEVMTKILQNKFNNKFKPSTLAVDNFYFSPEYQHLQDFPSHPGLLVTFNDPALNLTNPIGNGYRTEHSSNLKEYNYKNYKFGTF